MGKCHDACHKSTDCPPGQSCITASDQSTVCQLPAETHCLYDSECPTGLKCAVDQRCHNQCRTSVDCRSGQTCTTANACADPNQVDLNNNLIAPDAGVSGSGGASGTGGAGGQNADASPDLTADVLGSTGGTGGDDAPGTGGTISPSHDASPDLPADVPGSTGGTAVTDGSAATGGSGGAANLPDAASKDTGGIVSAGGTTSTGGVISNGGVTSSGGASSTGAGDAVLVKSFDISAAGPGPRMRVGDLNGDGRLDFLLCDATDDTPSYVAMLTAYDGYTGKMIWQVGSGGSSGTDRDEPCQIYDIDNDGNNEVLAAMGGKMNIYNGADGTVKSSFALPAAGAHDCIMIANISGNPIPMDIVVKDRYTQEWAMDNTGKLLWTYAGTTGHYNVPFDITGDGKDEMFTGYVVLDQTGKRTYPAPIAVDYPGSIWVGDVDGDPTNGVEVVYGLAQKPSTQCVNTKTGKVLWTNSDMTESQQLLLADYRPDLPGLEIYGLERTVQNSLDSLFIIDSTGKTLWKETGTNGGGGTAIQPIPNWDGTNQPMVLAFKRGSAQVWNGQHAMVSRLPMDGNAVVGDFGGDGKTEILMYSKTTANIYAIAPFDYNQPAPNPGHPLKQTREYYNYSRYVSGDVSP
jgi:hypothetical protein